MLAHTGTAWTAISGASWSAGTLNTFIVTGGIRATSSGLIWADGTAGSTPVSGEGTRLMWIPAKAAFRAGKLQTSYTDYWDEANIGVESVAFGGGKASGAGSIAFTGQATGVGSINLAVLGIASGPYSQNYGLSGAATEYGAINFGCAGKATGGFAINFAQAGEATGANANCFGAYTIARGVSSVSMGESCITWRQYGFTSGYYVFNNSAKSFTVGDTMANSLPAGSIMLGTTDAQFIFYNSNFLIADKSSLSGAEKITNGSFTGSAASWTLGAAWAYSSNTVVKNADGTSTLSQAVGSMASSFVVGEIYRLNFSITAWTVGNVTISVGGTTFSGLTLQMYTDTSNTDWSFTFLCTDAADALTFTPTSTARFTVDNISIQRITGGKLNLAGDLNSQGNVTVAQDSALVQLGAGQDLKLYHDGTDSFIYNDTGVLKIQDAGSGIKIGTATTQLLGFYGVAPVDQPATVSDAATQDLTGADTVDKTKLEADLTSVKNAVNTIIDRLQELGLVA